MKTVLKNLNEVAHFWANQVQSEGKSSSMFFKEETIYSYGYHFIIAKYIKGTNICLLNSRTYSSSTSRHQAHVRRAIPNGKIVFNVPNISDYKMSEEDHKNNLSYYIAQITENLQKSAKARTNAEYLLNSAISFQYSLKAYCKEFELSFPELENFTNYLENEILISDEFKAKVKADEKIRQEKIISKNKEEIEEWKAGIRNYISSAINKIYLRLKSDSIETSHGANVPLNEGKLLYMAIMADKDVKGRKIGNYTVMSKTDKILTIGCHKLEIEEIKRFAKVANF